ncbi:MAG: hypothetical protein QXW94_07040, partial [Desulfurococcaceae archaeon]
MEAFPLAVDELVRRHFSVVDWKVHYGVLHYVVADEDTKLRFLRLYSELEGMGYLPVLRMEGGRKVLRVFKSPPRRRHKAAWNVVLLAAALATISFAGYLFTASSIYDVLDPAFSAYRPLHL